jgi:hypothetical protein
MEVEFNEVELLPKTKEATIMAATAYIAANASNDDEHMWHLQTLALEGVGVLQGTNEQGHDATPRRNIPPAEQFRYQAAAPAVAPRPQVVEPINGELRHGLAQNRVDLARARDVKRVASRTNASQRHSATVGMDCVAQNASASSFAPHRCRRELSSATV